MVIVIKSESCCSFGTENMKYYFILVFCFCACEILGDVVRLDRTVLPNHYSIKIRPYIDEKRFEGEVHIYVTTTEELKTFTLHSVQLNISEARIDDIPADVTYPIAGRVQLSPSNNYPVQRGEHILCIKYNGLIYKEGTGLLMVETNNMKQGYILITEHGEIGARKVFPCFDDPAIKSKFGLKVITPDSSYNVFTKMPEVDKFHSPSGVVHVFETTPKISTYLVTFVITKYPYYEDVLKFHNGNVPIRLYSLDKSESNKYIVDYAKEAIRFYTEFTNIIPIKKIDLIEYSPAGGNNISLRSFNFFGLNKKLSACLCGKQATNSTEKPAKRPIWGLAGKLIGKLFGKPSGEGASKTTSGGESGGGFRGSFGGTFEGTSGESFGGAFDRTSEESFEGTSGEISSGESGGFSGGMSGGEIGGFSGGVSGGFFGGVSGGISGGMSGVAIERTSVGSFGGTSGGTFGGASGGIFGGASGGTFERTSGGSTGGASGGALGSASGGVFERTSIGSFGGASGGAFGGAPGGAFERTSGGSVGGLSGGAFGGAYGGTFEGISGGSVGGASGGAFGGASGGPFERTPGGSVSGASGGAFGGASGGTFERTSGGSVGGASGGAFGGASGGTFERTPGGSVGGASGGAFGFASGGTFERTPGGSVGGASGGAFGGASGGTFERTPGGSVGGASGGAFGGASGGTFERTPAGSLGGAFGGAYQQYQQADSNYGNSYKQTQSKLPSYTAGSYQLTQPLVLNYTVSYKWTEPKLMNYSYTSSSYQQTQPLLSNQSYSVSSYKWREPLLSNHSYSVSSYKWREPLLSNYSSSSYQRTQPLLSNYSSSSSSYMGKKTSTFSSSYSSSYSSSSNISFRRLLLDSPVDLGEEDQDTVKDLVRSEIANYWFGYLVTNEWWDDVWLHDALSTYLAYKLHQNELQRVENKHDLSFQSSDAFFEIHAELPSTPIVHQYTEDSLTNSRTENIKAKGTAVLLMLEDAIGEKKFRRVINKFLRKHRYSTATTNDFISLIEDVGCCKCRDSLVSYLYQQRLPQINVEKKDDTFVLQQEISATVAEFPTSRDSRWTIPIKYVSNLNSTKTLTWFDKDMEFLTVKVPEAKWILLNVNAIGIYKVNYAKDLWEDIIENFEDFKKEELYALSHEAQYSFEFDMIECSIPLRLMQKITAIKKEAWIFFIEFHRTILDRLICDNHKEELDIYKNFLNKKFKEMDYSNKQFDETPEKCLHEDHQKFGSMDTCAKWIKDNLQ